MKRLLIIFLFLPLFGMAQTDNKTKSYGDSTRYFMIRMQKAKTRDSAMYYNHFMIVYRTKFSDRQWNTVDTAWRRKAFKKRNP